MIGLNHALIVSIFIIGVFLGGVAIDGDHVKCLSMKGMIQGIFTPVTKDNIKPNCIPFFHRPMVFFGTFALLLGLLIGLMFHFLMDLPWFLGHM